MTNQEFIESIRLKGEEWREIPGWERYAASTDGRIASLGEPYLCGARVCCRKPQLLTPRKIKGTTNYLSVVLSNGEGNRRSFLVHCLVARTFIPNPQNLPFINHKDENPSNNKCENLEWCTQKYNCNYGTHKTRMAKTISENAYQRKKVVQLSLDGSFVALYDSIAIASRTLGINRTSISLCCRGINQTGKGYCWMYLSDYENLVSMSKNSGDTQED